MKALSLVLLCGLLLAACGSSTPAADVTQTVNHTVTVPATTTTGALTTETQTMSGAGTITASTTPACNHDTLYPSYGSSQGAAGTIEMSFQLTNNGTVACHTYGYPGFQFTGAGAAPLPTKTTWSPTGIWGTIKPTLITLQPKQSASFFIAFSDVGASGGGPPDCTAANGVQIIAPDDTFEMHALIVGGAATECKDVDVSALEFGIHNA
jgi:uncharacterized protein DUF4232